MKIPDDLADLAEWREAFLAGAGVTVTDLIADGYEPAKVTGDRYEQVAGYIPARYSAALADEPGVLAWMTVLLHGALANRRLTCPLGTGPSLLLLGPTGTGKTYQAYGVMRGLAACGVTGRFRAMTAADLYARMRPRHGIDSEAEFRDAADAALLVLDDLGAAKGSEWNEEVSYRLVNHRYEHSLPTLFTSNVAPAKLAEALGERVASRLAEMTGRVVLKGSDRRYAA